MFSEIRNKIFTGNAADVLKDLPDNCIDCTVSSPAYYMKRDYGTSIWIGGDSQLKHNRVSKHNNVANTSTLTGTPNTNTSSDALYKTVCKACGAKRTDEQIGLEKTPAAYTKNILDVFAQVYRVTKETGVL